MYLPLRKEEITEITTNIYHFLTARWANAVVEGLTIHTRALLRKEEAKM